MQNKNGFTLLESLIGAAILVIFFSAVGVMTNSTIQLIGESRVRVLAANLAQERLEVVRNMTYADVGTLGGIPAGILAAEEVVNVGGLNYQVETFVSYVDDPFDEEAPDDIFANDYKRVKVDVSWGGTFASRSPLSMWTDVAPKGLESDVGGGTMAIQVINAQGEPVESADVSIDASSLVPPVDIDTETGVDGLVLLPGAPICDGCYEILVTKDGYTSDRTYGTSEVTNPTKPHLSVLEGELTQASFAIDQPSSVTFKAVRGPANGYSAFQGVQMQVHGSKEIGRTAADEPIYVFDQAVVSGPGGLVTVNDMVWDTYTVGIPSGSSVDFAGSWPFTPFSLLPNSSASFTVVVEAASPHTLLVRVLDNLQVPIASGSVELKNLDLAYIATQSTAAVDKPDRAQTFFKNLPTTLLPYTVTVRSMGFLDTVTEATVSGDVVEQFILTPN